MKPCVRSRPSQQVRIILAFNMGSDDDMDDWESTIREAVDVDAGVIPAWLEAAMPTAAAGCPLSPTTAYNAIMKYDGPDQLAAGLGSQDADVAPPLPFFGGAPRSTTRGVATLHCTGCDYVRSRIHDRRRDAGAPHPGGRRPRPLRLERKTPLYVVTLTSCIGQGRREISQQSRRTISIVQLPTLPRRSCL
jgi:hypothetical protein